MTIHPFANLYNDVARTLTPGQAYQAFIRRADELAIEHKARTRIAIDPDVVRWAESTFWIPELKGPIQLHVRQRALLREARRKDANGHFIYSTVVWSDIKKSAKSTIAATVGLHTALSTEYGQVLVVANDLKQASSRVGEAMMRAVKKSPHLTSECRVIESRNRIELTSTGSVIEFIPIDPEGEAGSNADLIIFSELWGAHHEAQKLMWAEMTLSPTKFGKSQRWIETYAGHHGEAELLWSLYQQGKEHGRLITLYDEDGTPLDGVEVWANDAARLLCYWNTTPYLTWQTPEYYAQEESAYEAIPQEYMRVHRNQWVSSVSTFVDMSLWDRLGGQLPPLDRRVPLVLGVDAAEKKDYFAIVGVCRWPKGTGNIAVRYCRVWKPPKGGKISFRGTPDDPGPISILEDMIKHYYVLSIAYDPAKLELAAQDLQGKAWLYEFSQAGEREKADMYLRDLIINERITHDGNADLREGMTHAKAKQTGTDKAHIRIVKSGTAGGHIDAVIGLSMAAYHCIKNIQL